MSSFSKSPIGVFQDQYLNTVAVLNFISRGISKHLVYPTKLFGAGGFTGGHHDYIAQPLRYVKHFGTP